jgi:TRAP-type C4-dicarboxylate transport system permease small subunit
MSDLYVRAMDWVYRLCIWIAGACLLFMVFVYLFAIYARFRPGFPEWLGFLPMGSTSWPEPLSNICMISFSFIGAAAAYRAGGHISITMLTDHVGETTRKVLRKIVDVCMLITCIFIIVWGIQGCSDAWTDVIASLPFLTSGMVHIPIVIGSFLTALFVIESLIAGPQNHRELVRFGSPSAGH